MKFKAKIIDLSTDIKRKGRLLIEVNPNLLAELEELAENDVDVEIKKHSEKRSLDYNAFCWVKIGQLSAKLKISRNELYRGYIKDIEGLSIPCCVRNKDLDKICKDWESKGLGWQTEKADSKVKDCTTVYFYAGSSAFSVQEMTQLRNLIKQDCDEQNISWCTPEEEETMKRRWENKI